MRAPRGCLVAVVAALALFCRSGVASSQEPNNAARPNIVVFYADDLAAWALGSYGQNPSVTSNLDRLAARGARFTQAFTVTPVCSPSRAGMMTGRYPTQLKIDDWIDPGSEPDLGLALAELTWPELLQRAGYRTGLFGKWHLGTRDEFHPTRQGYDQFIGMRHGAAKPIGPTMEIDGKDQEVPGAVAEILVEKAGKFIEANRTRPFLASIHFREPHAPYAPVPEEDAAAVRDLTFTVPDYPGLDRNRVTRLMREYLASVHLIDRTVGKLLDRITALGLDGNTIIVFTSDHGYMIGHHGLLHKGNGNWILEGKTDRRPNMFDDAVRVPLLIYWPGVTREGQVIERVVSNLDLFPTLLAMARVDAPAPEVISGQNLTPLIRGAAWPRADVLFGQYDMHHGTRASMRMLRTPEQKLILHLEPGVSDELYDLKRDPGETTNLVPAGGELPRGYQGILNDLIARMRAIQDPRTAEAELRASSVTSAPAPKP